MTRLIIRRGGGDLAVHFSGCFSFFPSKGWVCDSRVTFWNCLESVQIDKGAKSRQESHNMPFTEAWPCYLKKRSKSFWKWPLWQNLCPFRLGHNSFFFRWLSVIASSGHVMRSSKLTTVRDSARSLHGTTVYWNYLSLGLTRFASGAVC